MRLFPLKSRIHRDASDIPLLEISLRRRNQPPADATAAGVCRHHQRKNATAKVVVQKAVVSKRPDHSLYASLRHRDECSISRVASDAF